MSLTQAQLNYTQIMYIAYYGRPADPGGLQFWAGRLAVEGPAGIANAFGTSAEFNANYGSLNNEDLVNGLYLQLFGRDADPGGLAFYAGGLASGAFTLPGVALRIIDGVRPGSGDDLIVANRLDVANYATNLAPESELLSTVLDRVTGQSATVTQALDALGIEPEERERFDLSIGDDDEKVGTSSYEVAPPTAQMITSGDVINVDDLRNDPRFSNIDGGGYTVVVLDTGIDLNHPAFGPDNDGDGVADRIVFHQDFSGEGDGTANDVEGHGTHVASTIGSVAAAYPGIAPGVNIIALQVLDNSGSGGSQGIERALQWVVANQSAFNIVAINLSLGSNSNFNSPVSGYASDEFAALEQLGVITVAAAGNSYFEFQAEGVSYPSADPNAIAVGATFDSNVGSFGGFGPTAFTTDVDRIVPFSQRSDVMTQIFAPGAIITGAAPGGGSVGLSGTSMASPHIAGVAALAQQIADEFLGRRLSPDEFLGLLTSSAIAVIDGDDEDDNVANTGDTYNRVDMLALAEAIIGLGDGTPPPPPGEDPDTVPGDPSTTANLPIGTFVQGVIDTRGDTDWYRVSLEEGRTYDFTMNGTTLADPWLAVHGPNGAFITSNNDSGGTQDAAITFVAPSTGVFFLSAEAFGQAQTGTFLLEATIADVAYTDPIPGDSSTTTELTSGAAVESAIDFGGDEDWLRLSLQSGVTYTLAVTGTTSGGGSLTDPVLEVYDASGNAVAFNDDGGPGLEPLLNFTPSSSGTFFAGVRAFNASQTGSYTITLEGDEADVDGDSIPDDSSTTATLASGGQQQSSIDFANDEDWFRVSLSAEQEYVFELNGLGSEGLSDGFLTLYSDTGAPLASDDDGGEGFNARLAFTPDASATYYIGARGFGSTVGDYNLSLDAIASGADDSINGVVIGDAGGERGSAAAVTLDGDGLATAAGSAGFGADAADYYLVQATGDGIATFTLAGLSANLDIALEDASGQVIEGSYGAGTAVETLTVTVADGQSYFLRVDPYASAASPYTLDFNLPAASTAGPEDAIDGVSIGDAGGSLQSAAELSSAQTIAITGSTGFGSDDGDIYRLVAADDGAASFELTGLQADIDLALYNASGTLLAASNGAGSGAELIEFPLVEGSTYYVYVYPFGGASEYNLDLQLPVPAGGAGESVNGVPIGDAGNSESGPTGISLDGAGDALITGGAGEGDDIGDYFRFQASGSGVASFDLFGLSDDLDVAVWDDSGELLAYEPAFEADSEQLTLSLQAGEAYVVGVFPWDDAVSDYTLLIDTSESSAEPEIVNGVDIVDAGDVDSPYAARVDAEGVILVDGSIGFGGDAYDAFRFTAPGSGELVVDLYNFEAPADLDLYLYDSDGDTVASSRSSTDGEDESIAYEVQAGETYTVEVYAWAGSTTYFLDILAPLATSGTGDRVDGIDVGDAPFSVDGAIAVDDGGEVFIDGSVGFANDDGDAFSFVALDTGIAFLDLFDLSEDIDLGLFDAEGDLLAISDEGGSNDEFLEYEVTAGEEYVVAVLPYGSAESDYSLVLDLPTSPGGGGGAGDRVNGVTLGDAGGFSSPVNIGAVPEIVASGAVGNEDDSDAITFTVTSSTLATFGLEMLDGTADADLDLYLVDSAGEVLAFGEREGIADEFFEYALEANEEYTLVVVAFTGASDYDLFMAT